MRPPGDDLVRIDRSVPQAGRSAIRRSKAFEEGLCKNDPDIAPSQIYAYAALEVRRAVRQRRAEPDDRCSGAAGSGAETQCSDLRQGFQDRADVHEDAARAGTEGAHAGHERLVLDEHPRQSRRRSSGRSGFVQNQGRDQALGAGTTSCSRIFIPLCTRTCITAVRINYYPPRGDAKEGWDNIDIFGWLGYPMQIKIDFLCRDSILAAPIVLDLVLFMDLAQRAGMRGIQEWLSFYFKAPMTAPGLYPEHDIFIQLMKLKNTLRWMRGEDLITHLGLEYYD